MLSFKSFALAMVLVSSTEAESTSLRSTVSDWSRRLSFSSIAGYKPKTLVADHAAIDGDLAAMALLLSKQTESTFEQAKDIYERGSFSKSIAEITFDENGDVQIDAGTVVSVTLDDLSIVIGTVMDDVPVGTKPMRIQYQVLDNGGSTCNVGGNPTPVLDGCFPATGSLEFEEFFFKIPYTYNPGLDNKNARTIQGFSTSADKKMKACDTCDYYEDFQKFVDYYGDEFYADKWVSAAFDGSSTSFDNGNGDFQDYSLESRAEVIKKGAAYMNVAMYVIRELEDAIDDCNKGCATADCNDDSVHALDEAVAFYTGSLEDEGNGQLMYALADKRCSNFNTCGTNGDSSEGKSKVNYEIFNDFDRMKGVLTEKNCDSARTFKESIVRQMFVPIIQGTLRYAYFTGVQPDGTQKSEAEGAAFAAAVLPMVYSCSPEDGDIIYKSMKTGQANSAQFLAVKEAFERNYDCLGITCQDVGGLWNSADEVYFEGAEPCGSGSGSSSSKVGVAVGSSVGGVVFLALVLVIYRSRRSDIEK